MHTHARMPKLSIFTADRLSHWPEGGTRVPFTHLCVPACVVCRSGSSRKTTLSWSRTTGTNSKTGSCSSSSHNFNYPSSPCRPRREAPPPQLDLALSRSACTLPPPWPLAGHLVTGPQGWTRNGCPSLWPLASVPPSGALAMGAPAGGRGLAHLAR